MADLKAFAEQLVNLTNMVLNLLLQLLLLLLLLPLVELLLKKKHLSMLF